MRTMKYVAIPLFLFSAFSLTAQVTIIGKVRDSLNNEIILYEPINNVFNYEIEDSAFTISLDADNRFTRIVNVNIPMQVIIVAGPVICPFFAFPKDTINIEINVDNWSPNPLNTKKTLEFHGRNKLGNELFHQAYFPGMGMTSDFDNDLKKGNYFGGLRRISQFDSILKMQTIRYDKLLREKAITRNFHRYVTKIIHQFLLTHHLGTVYRSEQYTTEEKVDYIGKMLDFYKVDPLDPIQYNNFYGGSISFLRYLYPNMVKHRTVSPFSDKNIIINNRSYFLNANLAGWREAPVKIQESLWALELISLKRMFPNSYDERDVETYLAVFPNSPFKKYFQPPHFGSTPWTKQDSASVVFISPTAQETLKTLFSTHFKHQAVLIDLWATWCAPCKAEFIRNPEIDKFCLQHNIKRLYISIDRAPQESAMIRDIYAHKLAGTHVRTTYSLEKDIVKNIYDGKEYSLTIPRYILVNENGQIVDANLVRPSSGEMFFREIERKLEVSRSSN